MAVPQLILLIVCTLGGLSWAYYTQTPFALGFLPALVCLVAMTVRRGYDLRFLLTAMVGGIKDIHNVLWIFILIGLIIPSWMASGCVSYLIETGLLLLNPHCFLTTSFMMTAAIAMLLGTAIGSVSAVGIPLIGVAVHYGVPLPCIAGAIISGAFFGDRTSPLSSAYHLVAACTRLTVREQAKAILPTSLAGFAVSCLFFLALDVSSPLWSQAVDIMTVDWHFEPWLAAPPLLLMIAMVLRVRTQLAFALSIIAALVGGSIHGGVEYWSWPAILWLGDHHQWFGQGKGLLQMLPFMVFVALTGAFNGVLQRTQFLQPYIIHILSARLSLLRVTVRVLVLAFGVVLVACNQTLPVMICGGNLLEHWQQRFANADLSRIVADSCLVFAGLIPWNMVALVCAGILGVTVIDYLPYAVLLYVLPLATLCWSWWTRGTADWLRPGHVPGYGGM